MGTERRRRLAMDEFDSSVFAAQMSEGRQRLGLSTRDLARLSGISQAYVVALERVRDRHARPSPTPTVDVVVSIAHALHLDPAALFAAALRPPGRHVLLVTDIEPTATLAAARTQAGAGVDTWIVARSPGTMDWSKARQVRTISVHDHPGAYDSTRISLALVDELQRLDGVVAGGLAGQHVGLMFTEMATSITSAPDPDPVLAFEHVWPHAVAAAVGTVGAQAEWNICVYPVESLRSLDDPVERTVDLLASHDTVWATHGTSMRTGAAATRRILERVRPPTVSASDWKERVRHLATRSGHGSR